MVNTGKPSRACMRCRTRRIKCDEARPQCMRCVRRGALCPGYRDKNSYVFRDDTSLTRERASKTYIKLAQVRESPIPSKLDAWAISPSGQATAANSSSSTHSQKDDSFKESDFDDSGSTSTSLLSWQPTSTALKQGAVSSFMEQIISGLDIFWTSFDCISDLCLRPSDSICLNVALEAISLMKLSSTPNTCLHMNVKTPALNSYGRAIKDINLALGNPERRLSDTTFLAIELICLFEAISGSEDCLERTQVHLKGLHALLAARGSRQFKSAQGRRVFLTSFLLWNTGTVLMHQPVSVPAPKNVEQKLSTYSLIMHEPMQQVRPLIDQALRLRQTALDLFDMERTSRDTAMAVKSVLGRLDAANSDFTPWYEEMCPRWQSEHDFDTTFKLNLARCHLILLEDLRLRCHQRLNEFAVPNRDDAMVRCRRRSRKVIEQICTSSAFDEIEDEKHRDETSVFEALMSMFL